MSHPVRILRKEDFHAYMMCHSPILPMSSCSTMWQWGRRGEKQSTCRLSIEARLCIYRLINGTFRMPTDLRTWRVEAGNRNTSTHDDKFSKNGRLPQKLRGSYEEPSQDRNRAAIPAPAPKPVRCPAREYGAGLSRFDRGPGPHPQRKTATAQAHAKR